jgi:hypothetical protein
MQCFMRAVPSPEHAGVPWMDAIGGPKGIQLAGGKILYTAVSHSLRDLIRFERGYR